MLGELRRVSDVYERPQLEVEEIDRDLVKLTPSQLRDQLVAYGVLKLH